MTFKSSQRKFIDQTLEELSANSSQISNWGDNGLLLREILELSPSDGPMVTQRILVLTKKLQGFCQHHMNREDIKSLQQFLSEKLLRLEMSFKNEKKTDCRMQDCEDILPFEQTVAQMRNPNLLNRHLVENLNRVSIQKYSCL